MDIKVLKGPYGLIWRDGQTESKEYSKHCYDINMWGCNIVWDKEGYQPIPVYSKDYSKWLEHYRDWRNENRGNIGLHIDKAIDKAIKHFELVSGLEGDAKDTWSDILS
jgi:hypothetical protein